MRVSDTLMNNANILLQLYYLLRYNFVFLVLPLLPLPPLYAYIIRGARGSNRTGGRIFRLMVPPLMCQLYQKRASIIPRRRAAPSGVPSSPKLK